MKCFEDDCLNRAEPPGNYCGKHKGGIVRIPGLDRIVPCDDDDFDDTASQTRRPPAEPETTND